MQIGGISHAERLKILLLDMDMNIPINKALQQYSNGVLRDTQAWGEIGIVDFYPNLDKSFIRYVYNTGVDKWRNGKTITPEDAINRMLQHKELTKNDTN